MRKFISYVTIVLLLLTSNILKAQLQFESSEKYGQLLDIRYSPTTENLLFARSVNNHILKSTDGGENWEIIRSLPQENNFIQVRELNITADGNHLTYICQAEGTAMNRVEVFNIVSEQVVKSIVSPIGEVSGSLIQSYSLAKENSDIALLHTTRFINWGLVTEVFYTQNGGEDWNSVYFSPTNGDISVNNVAISPFNNQKLYLLRGPSPTGFEGGMLISEDAGATWEEQIMAVNLKAISFHPTNQNVVFVGSFYLGPNQSQKLYRTNNGGMSWVEMVVDWTDLSTNSIQDIIINPSNPLNIVVVEENEIAISENAGDTWDNYVYEVSDYEHYYYGVNGSFNPFNENQLIISANYYPFISNDGGENFEKLETPFVNSTGRVGFFNGDNKHLYYGVRNGFVHKDLQTQEETPIGLVDIGFTSNNSFMGPFIDPNVQGRVFMGYSNWMGNVSIMMSNEHGENAMTIHTNSYIHMFGVDSFKNNPNFILMSFGELVYKFDVTNPENIVQAEISLPEFGIVENLIFGESENEFFIIQNNKMYKTIDNGVNWNLLNNGLEILSDQFIFDVAKSPFNANHLAIATSLGVFTTEDAGQTWNHSHSGQSYHKVRFSSVQEGVIMANSRFEDGYAYPSAHSQLVYSINNGEAWTVISTDVLGFLRSLNTEIVFHENEIATAYFLTPDLGLVGFEVDLEALSVEEINEESFTLFPNPSNGIFDIKSSEKIQQIQVFNLQGQKIKELKNGNWNISEMPKGVYLLKIFTEKGKIQFRKLIKK